MRRMMAAAAVLVIAASVAQGATPDFWETVWGYLGTAKAGDLVSAYVLATGEKVGEAAVKADGDAAGFNMVLFSPDAASREVYFTVGAARVGDTLATKPEELGVGVRRFDLGGGLPPVTPTAEPTVAPTPTVEPEPVTLRTSGTEVAVGGTFDLGLVVSAAVTQACDLYVLVETPTGTSTIKLDGTMVAGLGMTLGGIPGYNGALPFDLGIWNGIPVGAGLEGEYTFILVLTEAGKVPPVAGLDEVNAESQYVLSYDKIVVTVK